MKTKIELADLLKKIPGPVTRAWPDGEPFSDGLKHGSMSLELFAPRGRDTQQPHTQDELYIVVAGTARFIHEGKRTDVKSGTALFVPAGDSHRFEDMSDDFLTWVIFWGPQGGE